jgi:hypothetical protein
MFIGKTVLIRNYWERSIVKKQNNIMYVFGENAQYTSGSNLINVEKDCSPYIESLYRNKKYPTKSQAIIRGLNNAYPIITKKGPDINELFDINIKDFILFQTLTDRSINAIIGDFTSLNYDVIAFSENGYATGYARLPYDFAIYLCKKLNSLFKLNVNESNKNIKVPVFEPKVDPYYKSPGKKCTEWYKISVKYNK